MNILVRLTVNGNDAARNRNQKTFVADVKIADGEFKNMNDQIFNRLLLDLGEENEKT